MCKIFKHRSLSSCTLLIFIFPFFNTLTGQDINTKLLLCLLNNHSTTGFMPMSIGFLKNVIPQGKTARKIGCNWSTLILTRSVTPMVLFTKTLEPSMRILLKNNRTNIGFSFSILHSASICSSESHWIIMRSVESQSSIHPRLLIIPAI